VVEEALGGWLGNSAGRPGMACGGAGPTCLPSACDLALGKLVFYFFKKEVLHCLPSACDVVSANI